MPKCFICNRDRPSFHLADKNGHVIPVCEKEGRIVMDAFNKLNIPNPNELELKRNRFSL
jgi:hypothetical protein